MLTTMQEVEAKQVSEINWDDLLPRLILYSLRLIKSYDLEERLSPEDVALSAIERFMTYYRDAPPIQNSSAFLMRVARNIIIDQVRERRREEISTTDNLLIEGESLTREVESKEFREALLQVVRDDPKVAELVETLLEDPSLQSRQLAERLGVRLPEVYRLKKRLSKKVLELAHSH